MANELVRFTMGTKTDLGTKTKEAGQILFVLNDDNKSGSIYLDKDATHRIRMSHDLKDTSNSFSESAVNVTTYSGKVYPVALDADGYLAVSVPWTNTTYSAGTGLTLASGNKFNHTNSITAGTASGSATGTISFGGTITIPSISYDSEGHITSTSTTTLTLPANPNVDTKVNQTNTTGNDNYRVLFSGTADDTTRAEGARKNTSFKYNPSTTTLSVPKINTTGNISITNISETDKFLNFSYAGADAAGASWRLGHLGSGSGDTNYFVIQSGTSNTSATTWNNVLRLGMNTYDATFSGNVNPAVTNTKTLGTSDLKWANVYATTFTGNLSGNATSANSAISASKFTAAQSITLTGDVTGTASSVAGWSIATTLKDSGATAGDYGNTGDVSATYGGTFKVPTLTVDSKGIVTAISEKTITLPASDNVDNKVSQTITSTNANYRVLFSGTADNTTRTEGARKDGDFYYNPSTNTLTVPTVAAALSGNATTATTASKLDPTLDAGSSTQPIYFDNGVPVAITGALANDITGNAATATTATSATSAATATTANKLGTTTVGGVNKPIYLSNGAATEANTYAGGTAVTLNGSSKASSTASFYAPTGAGTSGQYLKSSGTGAPTWATFPTSMTPTAHSHGNVTNDGKVGSTTETLATDDFIIIGDNSASGKIIRGPKFDTSVTNKALTQAGTWAAFTANTGTVTSIATGTGLTGGPITTSGTISLADSGVTANSYGNAANATVSALGGTFKTTYLTVDAKGRITAASDKTMTVNISDGAIGNAKLTNSSMSIAGSTVSLGGTLSADTLRTNLGLSTAMHYRGKATVALSDGGTQDPTITGYDFTNGKMAGDVVIDKDSSMEYVWSGTAWERLGSETSFKTIQTAKSSPSASGTATSFIDTISQDTNGVITATKKSLPSSLGVDITGNAATATTLETARTIAISGGATGTATSFDGSDNITIPVTALDVSKASAGTLAVARGGTGVTAVSAYEILYGNTSNNGYARLTPNTTITKKFLRMTGTGSAGAAPAWDTVTKSDVGLGNVENTKLSTWTGNTSISSIGTLTTGSIPWSLLTGIPSSFTPGTHSHGNITNDGKTSTAITLANNDFIIVGDSSDNGRIGKGPVFDASTETTALTQKGTWVTYAGGTAVTLNGTSKAKSTASFYAPTASGTANQVLISGGANTAPSWTNQSNLSVGSATLAASAQKFDTNRTISLTGDTTGSASSNGASGWSITTTTKKLSQTTATALSSFTDTNALIYTAAGGSNTVTDKPTSVDAFGALSFKTADGWYGQLLMSSNNATGIYWRTATSLSGGWKKILDSTNYTDYTVTKTGSGASGSWGISITGNAATATTASKLGTASAGSATKPIYWANGIPAEANTYAGGTAVTLNGTSKASSTASFYAPEGAGTSGQYLKSNGSGAPTWATFPTSMTPTSHTHGNITNAGTMNPSQITIANNDFIVVGDSSDSTGKITKGPIFDGSTTTSVLSQKGTWVAASPSVSITAGTSSAAPKVNITVLGASGTAQAITTASTSVYGVTKLSSTASSSEEGLAATPKGVQAAINALDVSDAAVNGQYVKQVTQTDGKITVTRADFAPSISITAGTSSAAPKVNVTVNTKSGTAQSITTATTGVYGVTKLSSTSSTSEEGLAATPKGVWNAIDTVKYKVTQTADANNSEYPILTKSTVGVATVTETVKFNSSTGKQTTINPSTGTISANSYKVADKVQLQYDATTESLNFVFI